jgi:hypothetical protein
MLTTSSTATAASAASALLEAPELTNRSHEIVLDTVAIGHAEANRQLRQDFAFGRHTGSTSQSVERTRPVKRSFCG